MKLGATTMATTRLVLLITLSLCVFVNSGLAQNSAAAPASQTATPSVTASISAADTVRFAAPGQVLQIRLEIYSANGDVVSDSGMRAGNIVDWKTSDAAQTLTDGQYLTVVTVRDFQGKFRQRLGGLTVQAGQLTLKNPAASELTAAQTQTLKTRGQSQKVEAADSADVMTILRDGKERAVVVTGHDGQEGQIATTTGPLTFRTGDFFSNRAKEQMRIMPDGRVGIGTSNPQATLDVAGRVRAQDGIVFGDGTVLKSAKDVKGSTIVGVNGAATTDGPVLNAAGSGTAGVLSKWIDGAGTLGDSVIKELNGKIGIGTANPASTLHLSGPGGVSAITLDTPGTHKFRFQTVPAVQNWGAFTLNANYNSGWNLDDTTTNGWFFKLDTRGGNAANDSNGLWLWRVPNGGNPHVDEYPVFGVTNGRVFFNDNVGINTNAPTQKLEVNGNLKVSTVGNGIIFPDGTKLTSANPGGGAPSGTAIVSSINDAATVGVISETRLSPNVAKLNTQNAWTGQNTFVNGLSSNGVAITNVGNPVSATDATNKSYVDANFIKFVPGAEQLSVGDANGTAPMINLRGGSTCCSGPGAHTPAWFKVFQNGSFVATGNLGIGVSPMQGKGYRTSWDSYKGAFRSGYADAEWDDANVGFFSWAGGSNSTAVGLYALAFGDTNSAESTSSIVFGSGNQVKGAAGFSAGAGNRVCDTYGVALGNNAKSGGPLINGRCDPDSFNLRGLAAIAIGYNVTADQDHTTAMGKFASNNGFAGTFVWSDGSAAASADTFRNTANNEFAARATGGFRFRTNLAGTTGCNLPAGSGVFNCTSSRATKENFLMVSGEDVLSKLRAVPVSSWNYISEGKSTRHMGPMAEDFYQAFNLGTGSASIGVQDLTGVSLAAIKALDQRTNELQQKTVEVEQLRNQVNELRAMNNAIEQRLAALEQKAQQATPRHKSRR
jgi:hypothetical protein